MRLMIIGSDKVFAIENHYQRHLQELGVNVHLFCAQTLFYDYYYKNIVNKLLFKAGLSKIHKEINKEFRTQVNKFNPEVIWVFKGMEITPESLKWAKSKNILLVNYNPDNPFIFTGTGSGNKNVIESLSLYDLHFSYNLDIKRRLENEYQAHTYFLPFGYDVPSELLSDIEREQEVIAACFLGNPDKQRASFITELANKGSSIDLYGNDWQHFVNHTLLRIYPPVYGLDFWKTLRRYRVQLNLMRIHNEASHNMRTFEVAGIGGIQLAPDTPEHRTFFKDGEEIFLYREAEDCSKLLNDLLQLDTAAAMKVRNQARERCLKSGYTYAHRAQEVLQVLKDLRND